LDANEDEVADSEARGRTAGVDALAVSLATVFDNRGDNLPGEVNIGGGLLDVG
jgi:hypothetical protein